MTDSELRFRVTGDASGGAAALRKMVTPLQQIKQTATQAKTALAGIKSTKAKVEVDDAAVKRARAEITRLRDEMAKKLNADVTADTRQAQRRIRELEASIRTIEGSVAVRPDTVGFETSLQSGIRGIDTAPAGREAGRRYGSAFSAMAARQSRLAGLKFGGTLSRQVAVAAVGAVTQRAGAALGNVLADKASAKLSQTKMFQPFYAASAKAGDTAGATIAAGITQGVSRRTRWDRIKGPALVAAAVGAGALFGRRFGDSASGSGLASVKTGFGSFGAGISRAVGNIGIPIIGALGTVAAGAATGVGLLAIKTLMLADRMENSNIAFTQFLGSAAKSSRFLSQLSGFAAKTPFEFPELVESSKRLLAFNVRAKDVIPIMRTFGDAAALTGQNVDDLVTIYGQMFAKGKVANEELLQLTERGVPGYQILADKLGVSVSKVQKLATEGKLGAKALSLLRTGIDEKFGGGMAKQAKTLGGLISTLKDTVTGILTDVGTSVLPLAKSVFPLIQSGAESMGKRIKSLMPTVVNTIAAGLQGLLSLPGTLLRGLGTVTQGISGMVAGIQTSVASLVDGIATALVGIPGISNADVSGLRTAATDLRVAADQTNAAGKKGFDQLNAAAVKADASVSGVKAKLELTRAAAQQQMALQLKTDQFDTKISAVDQKIKTLKQQRSNVTLDADKKYFDAKIAAAQAEKKKLQAQKATVQVDAKIDALRAKTVTAMQRLAELKKQKPTPEVRAEISQLEAKVRTSRSRLSALNKERPKPRADLDYSDLKAGVAAANRETAGLKDRTVRVTIKTNRQNTSSKAGTVGGGVPNGFRVAPMAAGLSSLARSLAGLAGLTAASARSRRTAGVDGGLAALGALGSGVSINVPAPTIQIVTRDEALAEFVDVRIDGRSVRAVKVAARQKALTL